MYYIQFIRFIEMMTVILGVLCKEYNRPKKIATELIGNQVLPRS
jgi:hypothetical protein